MGREFLGLPASNKVHTWLPKFAQGTPYSESLAILQCQWGVTGSGWCCRKICNEFAGKSGPEPASPPSALKLSMQDQFTEKPSFGGFRCSGQKCRAHCYVWQLIEAGRFSHLGSRISSSRHQIHQQTFVDSFAGLALPAISQSNLQIVPACAQPMDLHNSNCYGIFNLPNDGVSCCMN